jgi:hypothetical protein
MTFIPEKLSCMVEIIPDVFRKAALLYFLDSNPR